MDALMTTLPDDAVIALTVWGEARGEGPEGRIAVANCIRNRAAIGRHFGATLREVCLRPSQFSCWMPSGGAENYALLMDMAKHLGGGACGPVFKESHWIAMGLLTSSFVDNVHGATHYLTTDLLHSEKCPSWAIGQKVLATIGHHSFLRVP